MPITSAQTVIFGVAFVFFIGLPGLLPPVDFLDHVGGLYRQWVVNTFLLSWMPADWQRQTSDLFNNDYLGEMSLYIIVYVNFIGLFLPPYIALSQLIVRMSYLHLSQDVKKVNDYFRGK